MHLKPFLQNPDNSKIRFSLNKLMQGSKQVVDLIGRVTDESGEPTFKLYSVVFSDGTECTIEGEHDFPYLADYKDAVLSRTFMGQLVGDEV